MKYWSSYCNLIWSEARVFRTRRQHAGHKLPHSI